MRAVLRPHGASTPTTTGTVATRTHGTRARRAREHRGDAARRRGARASSRRAARRSRARSRPTTWGGEREPNRSSRTLAARRPDDTRARAPRPTSATDGVRAARARTCATSTRPTADPRDPVGRDRYTLFAARVQRHRPRPRRDVRVGLGRAAPHRSTRCSGVGERILPGESIDAVIDAPRPRSDTARSKASTRSGAGTRTSSTRRSPSSTARTSTSPSRCTAARR